MNVLTSKTLEKLRELINGDGTDDYRSGPKLCEFFNELGFSDDYWAIAKTIGFPSRSAYTDEKLKEINGTPEIDKCIKNTFAVNNFIGRISYLDDMICNFNQYLAFDKWTVVRDNNLILLKRQDKVIVKAGHSTTDVTNEDAFLKQSFKVNIDALDLDPRLREVIKTRLNEIEKCISCDAPLAAVLLMGSIMEGLFLAMAIAYPKLYNQAKSAPKDKNGKVRIFPDWNLNNLIDVSCEVGLIKQDVKKLSHIVRDYRNYIHPYEQMSSNFYPDNRTTSICFQVLNAAIYQTEEYRKKNGRNDDGQD